jgi:arylsulfatase A-like enzyme
LQEEEIGMDHITDYLSVSFSATDYVGHIFGPSSLEAEDNLLRLDRTLAALLESVDKQIGLENTLVVFSSDHGAPDAPGHLNKFGIDAGYFDINTVDTASIQNSMHKRFDVDEKLVEGFYPPYVYLNNDVISSHNLDIDEVSRHMAQALQNQQGIAFAIAVADLLEGKIADTELNLAVLRNYHPKRSGHIYIVTEPYWFINEFDGLEVASTHGSPWKYDTHVPLIFAGNNLSNKIVFRKVETIDAALTLTNYLKIKPPSAASGMPLTEVLEVSESRK